MYFVAEILETAVSVKIGIEMISEDQIINFDKMKGDQDEDNSEEDSNYLKGGESSNNGRWTDEEHASFLEAL